VTRIRTGRTGVRFRAAARFFSFLQNTQIAFGAHRIIFSYPRLFPGAKRPWDKAEHSPPYSVKIKNEWSHTSAPSISLCSVYWHSFNFTFHKQHVATCRVCRCQNILEPRLQCRSCMCGRRQLQHRGVWLNPSFC
jgi:hypothetical protein